MGTLLWQLNDCWPVASWSITDYSREPKAAWYAVREAYRDDVMPTVDKTLPKDLKLERPVFKISVTGNKLSLSSSVTAKYVQLSSLSPDAGFSDNYFDLRANETKIITIKDGFKGKAIMSRLKIKSLYDVISSN
jgi:beta-mannosidase